MINKTKGFLSKASKLSLNKQFIFFVGIALTAILIIAAVNWFRAPDYSLLFSQVSSKDEGEIIKVLDVNGIAYKLLPSSGGILVAEPQLNQARMLLAKKGLPKSYEDGYQLLSQTQGVYTSQMNEELIRKRILEENLQNAIATLNGVQSVQVQLALPKHTDFMQQINQPTASVVLGLAPGMLLSGEQIRGIAHLVASAIPYMKAKDVTILDQSGELLTGSQANLLGLSSEQLKYKQQLENKLTQQIMRVLIPIVGRDNIRVEVSTDLNFDAKDNTTETYIPNKDAIQSEQTDKTIENNGATAQGIPGALTNQPPEDAKFGNHGSKSTTAAATTTNQPTTTHDRKTFNFALGKSITHTSFSKGKLENLSIALVLNDKKVTNQNGVTYQPFTRAEILNLESLAKSAIGFNLSRGDQIAVVNQKFISPPTVAPTTLSVSIWQQAWFMQLVKGLLLLIGLLIFPLFIWRPFYRSLFAKEKPADKQPLELPAQSEANIQPNAAQVDDGAAVGLRQFENSLADAKQLMQASPEAAAAVIKQWMAPPLMKDILVEQENNYERDSS